MSFTLNTKQKFSINKHSDQLPVYLSIIKAFKGILQTKIFVHCTLSKPHEIQISRGEYEKVVSVTK